MPYYAVAKGNKAGIYNTWDECKAQTNGYSGSVFKKFPTQEAAQEFVNSRSGNNSSTPVQSKSYSSGGSYRSGGSSYSSGGSYRSRGSYSSSGSSHPTISSTSFTVGTTHPAKKTTKEKIYVDGACRGNGKFKSPSAGYGVFYGDKDPRNAAVPLNKVYKGKPTNQRAELYAMNHALENINQELKNNKACRPSEIHSDSKYAIESVTNWSRRWKQEGWKTSQNKDVANADLIKPMVELKEKIDTQYKERSWEPLGFTHVRGHAGNEGNERADQLANLGADAMENNRN
ncbi:uncharacterized protein SPAPADRAFT_63394 [Spathaspora passalidarum NRRL Y-27907]|uniref:Ribonuclease H n=1 Tax=Spathaspora passalidarum (strain NRRL Y-27907 / 11-Y1) TaxID=619300 RepID=G3AUJ7_SPAPN|nr:uncharacterized protein SPAPADRAFT_63394 [Spathaspora passalidarum NRRL Y-27907]EGW30553.1 hypothetical protein SPAPADRAFT_63394 [Spathaspora passalidarum NRRL Y-27907]